MPYRYDTLSNPYVASIAETLARRGDIAAQRALAVANAQSQAQLARGQAWGTAVSNIGQTIGQIPQQMQQQKRAAMQDEAAQIQLGEAKRGQKARSVLGEIILKTPHVDEDGMSLYDIGGISKEVAAAGFGDHVADVATQLKGLNDAFRTERQARLALVQRGAQALLQADADPELTLHFMDTLERNGTFHKADLDPFRQIIHRDPSKVSAILRQFAGPEKIGTAAPGTTLYGETTGAIGPTIPDKPNTEAELAADAANPKSPTRMQSAAALQALQTPTLNAREETERHNRAIEDIGRMTAGRADAQANETARHNATMERIAQQNADTTAKRYTASGIDSTMDPAYATALERAVLGVPAARRPAVAQLANRLWSEGNTTELKDVIRQAAIESENIDTKNQVLGRMTTLGALRDLRVTLDQLQAKGVPTNWFRGSFENLARRLGATSNPEYAALSNQLMGTLINYRRAATGVQFSQREQEQYARMFPNYKNLPEVNTALLEGFERQLTANDRDYWTHKLGEHGAQLIGVGQGPAGTTSGSPTSQMPADGTEGTVNGVPAVWKTVNGKAGWYAK